MNTMKEIKLIFKNTVLIISALVFVMSCKPKVESDALSVTIKNSLDNEIKEQTICIKNSEFLNQISEMGTSILVSSGEENIPYQVVDKNNDGVLDKLLINISLPAKSEKEIYFSKTDGPLPEFKKRTQAEISVKDGGEWIQVVKKSGVQQYEYKGGEFKNISELRVPDNHTDHSFYIRYEGPGWESDKVGYRFYLDWRNAVDIFAKQTTDMVLQNVGQDGFDSYHEFSDWGMDVLKVGSSLGLGSIGFWDGNNAVRVAVTDSIYCKIIENGDLYSGIKTKYYGWKDPVHPVNLKSVISIYAGSRISWQSVSISDVLDNLCTGIVKHENGELIQSETESGEWAYIATFGEQSLNNDNLGMFVVYKESDLIEVTNDLHSHVVVLNPSDKNLKYGFGAVWEKDIDGISAKDGFVSYLDNLVSSLNTPIEIIY